MNNLKKVQFFMIALLAFQFTECSQDKFAQYKNLVWSSKTTQDYDYRIDEVQESLNPKKNQLLAPAQEAQYSSDSTGKGIIRMQITFKRVAGDPTKVIKVTETWTTRQPQSASQSNTGVQKQNDTTKSDGDGDSAENNDQARTDDAEQSDDATMQDANSSSVGTTVLALGTAVLMSSIIGLGVYAANYGKPVWMGGRNGTIVRDETTKWITRGGRTEKFEGDGVTPEMINARFGVPAEPASIEELPEEESNGIPAAAISAGASAGGTVESSSRKTGVSRAMSSPGFEYDIVHFDPHNQDMRDQLSTMILNDKEMQDLTRLNMDDQEELDKFFFNIIEDFSTLLVYRIKNRNRPLYVGFLQYTIKPSTRGNSDRTHGYAEAAKLAVDKAYRNQGIGKKLIQQYEKDIYKIFSDDRKYQKGYSTFIPVLNIAADSQNKDAIRLYQSLGYTIQSTDVGITFLRKPMTDLKGAIKSSLDQASEKARADAMTRYSNPERQKFSAQHLDAIKSKANHVNSKDFDTASLEQLFQKKLERIKAADLANSAQSSDFKSPAVNVPMSSQHSSEIKWVKNKITGKWEEASGSQVAVK